MLKKQISEKGNQNHSFIIRTCARRQDSTNVPLRELGKL